MFYLTIEQETKYKKDLADYLELNDRETNAGVIFFSDEDSMLLYNSKGEIIECDTVFFEYSEYKVGDIVKYRYLDLYEFTTHNVVCTIVRKFK